MRTPALLALCLSPYALALSADEPRTLAIGTFRTLDDPHGFGGPIAGAHGKTLIIAGGANFPDGPPWEENGRPPGRKIWHDHCLWLRPGMSTFATGPRLPHPLAYAPSVSTAEGLYVLGGETHTPEAGNTDTAEVLRLRYDETAKNVRVERNALPPLPKPCSYHAAGLVGRTILVAASHRKGPKSRMLDVASFWSLDLDAPADERTWTERPVWPGPARHKMAIAVARGPEGTDGERLYLFSGSTWAENDAGEIDLAAFRYYDDAFAFDPAANTWTKLASLPRLSEQRTIDTSGYDYDRERRAWVAVDGKTKPVDVRALFDDAPRPAAAATAVGHGDEVLLFSGSTGRYVTMAVQDRPPFPGEVLAYDIDSNRWSVAGRMETPVVTTATFPWNGRFIIASGEVRPGVRTRLVQRLWPKR